MTQAINGWSQTIAQVTGTGAADGVLNASVDTTIIPNSTLGIIASDRSSTAVNLVAGVAANIRWGGKDGFSVAGSAWGAGLAANTSAWQCDVMVADSQTSIATDSISVNGAGGDSIDRTFTFTPTVSGSYRLKVLLTVTNTTTGALVGSATTDEGNFFSENPNYQAADSNKSYALGFISVATVTSQQLQSTINSITSTPVTASRSAPSRGGPF